MTSGTEEVFHLEDRHPGTAGRFEQELNAVGSDAWRIRELRHLGGNRYSALATRDDEELHRWEYGWHTADRSSDASLDDVTAYVDRLNGHDSSAADWEVVSVVSLPESAGGLRVLICRKA